MQRLVTLKKKKELSFIWRQIILLDSLHPTCKNCQQRKPFKIFRPTYNTKTKPFQTPSYPIYHYWILSFSHMLLCTYLAHMKCNDMFNQVNRWCKTLDDRWKTGENLPKEADIFRKGNIFALGGKTFAQRIK